MLCNTQCQQHLQGTAQCGQACALLPGNLFPRPPQPGEKARALLAIIHTLLLLRIPLSPSQGCPEGPSAHYDVPSLQSVTGCLHHTGLCSALIARQLIANIPGQHIGCIPDARLGSRRLPLALEAKMKNQG